MATMERLPLDANWTRSEDGWLITLPLRAERIEVTREAVETEEVVVRTEVVRDVERVQAEALREELRVETRGDAGVTQRL
jgi:uncharacterized protein (TIGR02271 family)